jgi:lipoprotein-anchoring transpeptidase ErfK/SrfK
VLRKEALHVSIRYPEPTGGAKMPYSLWFNSGYYIHGYRSVPRRPASHGCIRVSIPNAKALYQWAAVGTPVSIYRTATA